MIYETYVDAVAPTLDALATAIAADDDLTASPSRDTIQRVIGEPAVPAKQADAVAVVTMLARMAGADGQQAGHEVAALWRQIQLAEPLGRPVREINAYDLEVHHEITWRNVTGLTSYISRHHDLGLQRRITEAAGGSSHLVMLVGPSSSGKTRACYEAVKALPDDWRLWHPIDPGRPQAALAHLGSVGPKTVIWLNEAHHYLLHPDHGEQIAASLRTLLTDTTRGPILVLGTMWPGPGYFDELLTTPPRASSEHGDLTATAHQPKSPDLPRTGTISAGRADPACTHRLHTPRSRGEQEVARPTSGCSCALGQGRHGHPIPGCWIRPRCLLHHRSAWTEGAPRRRHRRARSRPPPALASLLPRCSRRGIPHRHTEWDLLEDDWLEQAVKRLIRPMTGARGLLHRNKRPRGGALPAAQPPEPTYLLADFLVDYFRTVRQAQPVPDLFWQAAVEHSHGEAARALASAGPSTALV
ncbi:hypothetical protein J2X68_007586 [Streptomyces sp. 3330]|uniref:hypothetical protein n=1 Tax=Streptomyces sp. 3330 TaxID=2817755 RepID=UPI002865C702|nr:hypothetical protein [Streptomyces sp. 3330]MDR6980844.1 hypothetical protein [Streptomyces sp. 3330]